MSTQNDIDRLNKEDGLVPVRLPSGGSFFVHDRELGYFNDRRDRYLKDNHFVNVSDFQDLDRLIIAEMLTQRWGMWISSKRDYWGDPVDENQYQKALKEHSAEIRQLKKALGLDKETRDKVKGEDSVDAYIRSLRQRAKEFGVMRNQQAAKAIELINDVKARAILWSNCDEQEKIQQGCTSDQVIQWILDDVIPEFDEIDTKFKQGTQTYWVRDQ